MNLQNIVDDELVAQCRSANLANATGKAHCIVPRGRQWEVMEHKEALKQGIFVPDSRVTKKRGVA